MASNTNAFYYMWILEMKDGGSTKHAILNSYAEWHVLSMMAPTGVKVKSCVVRGEVQRYVGQSFVDPEAWAAMNETVRDAYLANPQAAGKSRYDLTSQLKAPHVIIGELTRTK